MTDRQVEDAKDGDIDIYGPCDSVTTATHGWTHCYYEYPSLELHATAGYHAWRACCFVRAVTSTSSLFRMQGSFQLRTKSNAELIPYNPSLCGHTIGEVTHPLTREHHLEKELKDTREQLHTLEKEVAKLKAEKVARQALVASDPGGMPANDELEDDSCATIPLEELDSTPMIPNVSQELTQESGNKYSPRTKQLQQQSAQG